MGEASWPRYRDNGHQIQAPKRADGIRKFNKTGLQAHFAQHQRFTYPADTAIAH